MLAGHRPRTGAGVRFLWGPEFVGTIAYLHDVIGTGQVPAPALAINIDMAGQDVASCGGPLVIERGPDDIASFSPALAARCAALLPPALPLLQRRGSVRAVDLARDAVRRWFGPRAFR